MLETLKNAARGLLKTGIGLTLTAGVPALSQPPSLYEQALKDVSGKVAIVAGNPYNLSSLDPAKNCTFTAITKKSTLGRPEVEIRTNLVMTPMSPLGADPASVKFPIDHRGSGPATVIFPNGDDIVFTPSNLPTDFFDGNGSEIRFVDQDPDLNVPFPVRSYAVVAKQLRQWCKDHSGVSQPQ